MSQAVEIVRRMYLARNGEDDEGALSCFHPKVVVDPRPRVDSGIVYGREELARVIGEWVAEFDDWREEIDEIRDLGSQVLVVATQKGRGKGSGLEIETRYALLYQARDRQITRMTFFREPAEALAAAGVEP